MMFLVYFLSIAIFWAGGLLIWNKMYAPAKDGEEKS